MLIHNAMLQHIFYLKTKLQRSIHPKNTIQLTVSWNRSGEGRDIFKLHQNQFLPLVLALIYFSEILALLYQRIF